MQCHRRFIKAENSGQRGQAGAKRGRSDPSAMAQQQRCQRHAQLPVGAARLSPSTQSGQASPKMRADAGQPPHELWRDPISQPDRQSRADKWHRRIASLKLWASNCASGRRSASRRISFKYTRAARGRCRLQRFMPDQSGVKSRISGRSTCLRVQQSDGRGAGFKKRSSSSCAERLSAGIGLPHHPDIRPVLRALFVQIARHPR